MNRKVEVTWRALRMIAHSLMVLHAQVLGAYIDSALIYMADRIFLVIPIKDLIKKDGDPTTTFKLATGTKSSILYLCVYFFCLLYENILHMLVQRR